MTIAIAVSISIPPANKNPGDIGVPTMRVRIADVGSIRERTSAYIMLSITNTHSIESFAFVSVMRVFIPVLSVTDGLDPRAIAMPVLLSSCE